MVPAWDGAEILQMPVLLREPDPPHIPTPSDTRGVFAESSVESFWKESVCAVATSRCRSLGGHVYGSASHDSHGACA